MVLRGDAGDRAGEEDREEQECGQGRARAVGDEVGAEREASSTHEGGGDAHKVRALELGRDGTHERGGAHGQVVVARAAQEHEGRFDALQRQRLVDKVPHRAEAGGAEHEEPRLEEAERDDGREHARRARDGEPRGARVERAREDEAGHGGRRAREHRAQRAHEALAQRQQQQRRDEQRPRRHEEAAVALEDERVRVLEGHVELGAVHLLFCVSRT